MRLDRLNIEPDDNYRVNYRDAETRRRYCWLVYGPRETWTFWACSRDGEPSHAVTPPAGMSPP